MLCLTLAKKTIEEDIADFWKNRAYIGIAEIRLDALDFKELEKVSSLTNQVDLPLILTCRRKADGGFWMGTEKKRIQILKQILELGDFSYIDIESDVKRPEFEAFIKSKSIQIIRSFHDFEGVPLDLYSKISKLASKGDIPKIAVTPKTVYDLILIFKVESELASIKEKIIIGMGPMGVCTRILYKKVGSMLCYCSDDDMNLGLLSPRILSELYRADRVNAKTHIYGVIGNPVLQSVSPQIHNPGFHAIRFNAIYVPFLVDNVRAFFHLAEVIQIFGFSVTIPHKIDVLPYLGKSTREVRLIGSCNTVVRKMNLWKGINTDYYGFINPLLPYFDSEQIHEAVVIGAGGASRAVIWALKNRGVKITILNRTVEKAKALALETMSNYDSLENADKYSGRSDLIVQTTPLGMGEKVDFDPAPKLKFLGTEIVYDLIYKPHLTKFLERANDSGCTLCYGIDMLVEQGKLQFEEFTGYHYPSINIVF
ncbi:MAG: shikimate dehydrogenase [Sphaerochaetaceae bacterium]|nr:shikimate dehydrogenase [Sphaerochaetaceae bacterium]